MEVIVKSDRPTAVEVELHFWDSAVYCFTAVLEPSPYVMGCESRTHVVGRRLMDVNKFLVKYNEYWYEEFVPRKGDGDLIVRLSGRDRATQMLRDAAMRAKPVVE